STGHMEMPTCSLHVENKGSNTTEPIAHPSRQTISKACIMWKLIIVTIGIAQCILSSANASNRLILCDTAEQIEQVFTLQRDDITFEEAIDAANKPAGRPNSCSKATVEATRL